MKPREPGSCTPLTMKPFSKALFKVEDLELTFAKAIAVAVETEEATKGSQRNSIRDIRKTDCGGQQDSRQVSPKANTEAGSPHHPVKGAQDPRQVYIARLISPKAHVHIVEKTDHGARDGPFKEAICHH